jgi:hypothetical protein
LRNLNKVLTRLESLHWLPHLPNDIRAAARRKLAPSACSFLIVGQRDR